MTPEIALLCFVAALLELDTTYAGQFQLSRGIMAGPLLSLITGDWMAGVQVGVFSELLFADISPLGGFLPPSTTICCAISLALYAAGIPLHLAFFIAVIGSILVAHVEKWMRKTRVKSLARWEQRVLQKPNYINRVILKNLLTSFLMNFLLLSFYIWAGIQLLTQLVPLVPHRADIACQFAYMAVPWLGLAALLPEFRFKRK